MNASLKSALTAVIDTLGDAEVTRDSPEAVFARNVALQLIGQAQCDEEIDIEGEKEARAYFDEKFEKVVEVPVVFVLTGGETLIVFSDIDKARAYVAGLGYKEIPTTERGIAFNGGWKCVMKFVDSTRDA